MSIFAKKNFLQRNAENLSIAADLITVGGFVLTGLEVLKDIIAESRQAFVERREAYQRSQAAANS